jgi:hypothetical protein
LIEHNIALWSRPRSRSTVLACSFEQRSDCLVVDEPFYPACLTRAGQNHPNRDAILRRRNVTQCNWLAQRAVYGLRSELEHSHNLVTGSPRPEIESAWAAEPAVYDDNELQIAGQQVVQA